jgi:hypothetical protein
MPASVGPVQDCTALLMVGIAPTGRGGDKVPDWILEPLSLSFDRATLFDIVDVIEKGCGGGGFWL